MSARFPFGGVDSEGDKERGGKGGVLSVGNSARMFFHFFVDFGVSEGSISEKRTSIIWILF